MGMPTIEARSICLPELSISTRVLEAGTGPVVLLLRFNQPVTHAAVDAHLAVAYQAHPFEAPPPPGDERTPAPAALLAAFEAKAAKARDAAALTASVPVRPTDDWDRKAFPPAEDLLVFETTTVPTTAAPRVTVLPWPAATALDAQRVSHSSPARHTAPVVALVAAALLVCAAGFEVRALRRGG